MMQLPIRSSAGGRLTAHQRGNQGGQREEGGGGGGEILGGERL